MRVTVQTVQEVCDRLGSARQKDREAALKDLKGYMDDKHFVSLLDRQTEESPSAASAWPAVVQKLCDCISFYLKNTKAKTYNTEYSKTLRAVMARACAHGRRSVLMHNIKSLYKHFIALILEPRASSFAPDYCASLGFLLDDAEYCSRLSMNSYRALVQFYLERGTSDDSSQQMLTSLIKHPPADLPQPLRLEIASYLATSLPQSVAKHKQYQRRLLESLIAFLKHDGPNLGEDLLKVHSGAMECWRRSSLSTTTDAGVKGLFILYLRMQMKLRIIIAEDDCDNLGQLFEFVQNELEGRLSLEVPLARSVVSLLHLAAHVLVEVLGKGSTYSINDVKRRKKENLSDIIADRVADGSKPLWSGAICFLIKYYGSKLPTEFLSKLFGILVKRLTSSGGVNTVEPSVWAMRCLMELSDASVPGASWQDAILWQSVWNTLVRLILHMSTVNVLVDEGFKLLGYIASKDLASHYVVPEELWNLPLFKQPLQRCSTLYLRSALFFVASFFSAACFEDFQLRKSLLEWCLAAVSSKDSLYPSLLSNVFLALAVGVMRFRVDEVARSWSDDTRLEAELIQLDLSDPVVAACGCPDNAKITISSSRSGLMRMSHTNSLLDILARSLLQRVQAVISSSSNLEHLLGLCALVSYCFSDLETLGKARPKVWTEIPKLPSELITCTVELLTDSSFPAKATTQITDAAASWLSEFVRTTTCFPLDRLLEAFFELVRDTPAEETLCSQEEVGDDKIADEELDAQNGNNSKRVHSWRSICFSMIAEIGQVLPQVAFDALRTLSLDEKKLEVRKELVLCMCKVFRPPGLLNEVPNLVEEIRNLVDSGHASEPVCLHAFSAAQILLMKLKDEKNRVGPGLASQALVEIVELLSHVNKSGNLQWHGRSVLCETISTFIAVDATLGQDPKLPGFLEFLSDPDFRVRLSHARGIHVLLEAWTDHQGLLEDLRSHVAVSLPRKKVPFSAWPHQAGDAVTNLLCGKTALATLGEIAATSELLEVEAVFTILAYAALEPLHQTLAIAILSRLSTRLGYQNSWKLVDVLAGGLLHCWVEAALPSHYLLKIRDLVSQASDVNGFLHYCNPFLLPPLMLNKRDTELQWIAKEMGRSVKSLVEQYLPDTISYMLASYAGDSYKSLTFLKGYLLTTTGMTESEALTHISKHNMILTGRIILLANADSFQAPHISRIMAVNAVKYFVDALLVRDHTREDKPITDRGKLLVPDRIFEILLQIHARASSCSHWRHRRHHLAKLEALTDFLAGRILVPSTFRYFAHIITQSVEILELQPQCLSLINHMVSQVESNLDSIDFVIRDQLEDLISKLVSCYKARTDKKELPPKSMVDVLIRLRSGGFGVHVKELDQLETIPGFELTGKPPENVSLEIQFAKFVRRLPSLQSSIRLSSLQRFLQEMQGNISPNITAAIWELVSLCDDKNNQDISSLAAEFLASTGIRDPHAVVFKLPSGSTNFLSRRGTDVWVAILAQICAYLADKDAPVIELAFRAAKVLLGSNELTGTLSELNQEKAYLEPFRNCMNEEDKQQLNKLILEAKVPLDDDSLWTTSGKTYDDWICTLVYSLVPYTNHGLLMSCKNLVRTKAAFAEVLLPSVFLVLTAKMPLGSKLYSDIVSQVVNHILSASNENTRSIQVFLDVLNTLRTRYVKAAEVSSGNLTWPKVYWLDVDYLLTAEAAEKCAAYLTSVLYVEHWCEEKFHQAVLGDPVFPNDDKFPRHLEQLLSVYRKLNEPDSLYGVVRTYNLTSQVRLYEHEGNWEKALQAYDLLQSSTDGNTFSDYHKGLVKTLQQLGCPRASELCSAGLSASPLGCVNDREFRELQYEEAWKSGKWDLNLPAASDDALDSGFHAKLFSSLQCLVEEDSGRFSSEIKRMREDVISHVLHTTLESTQNVHLAIVKLWIVDGLANASKLRWTGSGTSAPSHQQLLIYWQKIVKLTRGNYELLEPFANAYRVLLEVLKSDCLKEFLIEHAKQARKAGKLNQAAAAIQKFKAWCKGKHGSRVESLQLAAAEEAKVLWSQGQHQMATNILKYLVTTTETKHSVSIYCRAGKWLAETRSAGSRVILDTYLKKSVELAESAAKTDVTGQRSRTHFHLAHFANVLYQNIEDRLSSREWQAASKLRQAQLTEYQKLYEQLKAKKDAFPDEALIKVKELQAHISKDTEQFTQLNEDRSNFLRVCLQSYRQCLVTGDKYDIKVVFRLVSLWFKLLTEQAVVKEMLETVKTVQSYKFLPLVYQIASRLGVSKNKNDFQFVLALLVKKMAYQHPYHCLYQLLALANGDRVKNKKSTSSLCIDLDKKHAAEEVIEDLSGRKPDVIAQVKQMVEVYIKLAELPIKQEDCGKKLDYPRDIRSVKELPLVPIITAGIPVQKSCKYVNFPCFCGFDGQITIMRGINAPKVALCRDKDGNLYRQLAKSGNDDLRQDAVMQQFFGLVDMLLYQHRETQKRSLKIRTYKVIPFTPTAGALEWVNGTIPMGEYLLGSPNKEGAHVRYCRGDWSYIECRDHMNKETDKSVAFQTVCKNFRPAMRFFFREKFLRVEDWFEKRLNYTHSVAASSMVGYIVGLGDRHAMNILMDEATAEVVHIDFGVAFEQGLMLRSPETIPFRLTRDIVDGMGVTGTEGVFRRSCEATLSVLRANKEALLTIIEVFIHDPLYRWALSPLKALQKQKEPDDQLEAAAENFDIGDDSSDAAIGNKQAARALMRVKQKLDGYEEGELHTIEGQVQQLIQQAQDPERLCRLYPGWGSWL